MTQLRPARLTVLTAELLPLMLVTWPVVLPLAMLPRFAVEAPDTLGFNRVWTLLGHRLGRDAEWAACRRGARVRFGRRGTQA